MKRRLRVPRTPKPKASPEPKMSLGVSWYEEPEWSRVKSAAADPELFEATYDEWLAMAEEALVGMHKAGIDPAKVLINANDLLAWCLAYNKENNAATRAEFVAQLMRLRNEDGA